MLCWQHAGKGSFFMFVQLICKDRNQKDMNELYEVLGALCHREGVQIEDKGDRVEILVCPQGKILVTENGREMELSASTRHAGPGFHAFAVELFKDIEEEVPGEYELIDDMEYDVDEDFHRLGHAYENELEYMRDLILNHPGFKDKNYMYDETYFLPVSEKDKVATAMGLMDAEEFKKKPLEDLMDYFYVWNNWDRDARFYRNAALTLLAKEGYGEYSSMNDQTEKNANEIMDYLEIAHKQDPDLPLPLDAYAALAAALHRDNLLTDAKPMEHGVIQYRSRDVYHLFEDARVLAPGTAERSYDPVTQSVNLMAPYREGEEWKWLIQASKQPDIVPDFKSVLEQDPVIGPDGQKVYSEEYTEDGIPTIDAVIEQDGKRLYIHAVCHHEDEIPYLLGCIRHSGFVPDLAPNAE